MRLFAALALLAASLGAQSMDLRGVTRTWTELGTPAPGQLRLTLDSGEVTIHPSQDGKVRVRYTGRRDQDLSQVRLRYSDRGTPEFRLSNTPNEGFRVEIQIPRKVGLTLSMSAGDLRIEGIEGDKDLHLQAGELTVKVDDPAAYGPVSASVWAGEVHPGPFGESKEGIFRRFATQGGGRYALKASLKAGEIRFQR